MVTMPLHIDNERGSHYKESGLYSAYRLAPYKLAYYYYYYYYRQYLDH